MKRKREKEVSDEHSNVRSSLKYFKPDTHKTLMSHTQTHRHTRLCLWNAGSNTCRREASWPDSHGPQRHGGAYRKQHVLLVLIDSAGVRDGGGVFDDRHRLSCRGGANTGSQSFTHAANKLQQMITLVK